MTNALTQYLDRANTLAKLFGDKEYDLNSAVDRRRLAEKLDCDLSPENVSCDGELRGSALQKKIKQLNMAKWRLEALEDHELKHAMFK